MKVKASKHNSLTNRVGTQSTIEETFLENSTRGDRPYNSTFTLGLKAYELSTGKSNRRTKVTNSGYDGDYNVNYIVYITM